MKNTLHAGHRKRLREQFLSGNPDAMPDHVLLELFLFRVIPRSDTNPTAHRLLDRFGSLAGVFSASEEELASVDGVGKAAAAQIRLVAELFSRSAAESAARGPLTDPVRSAGYVFPLLFGKEKDTVLLVGLDGRGRIVDRILTDGADAEAVLREAVRKLKENGATQLILAHAHGSDPLEPSPEDREATAFTLALAEKENVTLLAHYLVGTDGIHDILPEVKHG